MFKKLLLLVPLLFFFTVPAKADSSDTGWTIPAFESRITVQKDGKVKVEENISVDFNTLQKHGIYRDIPYVYQLNNTATYTDIEVQSILLDSKKVPYKTSYSNGNIVLKIGDGDATISGKHTYAITYLATGVVRGFEGYDELYWNITGNSWPVPISSVSATVEVPEPQILQISCYQGAVQSTATCENRFETQKAFFASTTNLQANQGMTVAVGFTKGMIPLLTVDKAPTEFSHFLKQISIPVILVSFLVILSAGLIAIWRLWIKSGKDLGKRSKIVAPEFSAPGGLRPAEIGAILSEDVDTVYVSATIVDLAVRGYLTIEEIPKKLFGKVDYKLKRTSKKEGSGLREYEKILLNSLFTSEDEVLMSSLKNTFYTSLATIKKELLQELTQQKYFVKNPTLVRNWYYGIGFLMILIGAGLIFVGFGAYVSLAVGAGLAVGILGIITLIMAQAMPQRTAKGRELYQQAKGYELFVGATEKYRQPFFEKENIFMEILPYAIVFGVTDKLAKAFEVMGIETTQPSWYVGSYPFTAIVFAQGMNSFSSEMNSSMAQSPSSSGSGGGGFSGGGFGGGGGGSW